MHSEFELIPLGRAHPSHNGFATFLLAIPCLSIGLRKFLQLNLALEEEMRAIFERFLV